MINLFCLFLSPRLSPLFSFACSLQVIFFKVLLHHSFVSWFDLVSSVVDAVSQWHEVTLCAVGISRCYFLLQLLHPHDLNHIPQSQGFSSNAVNLTTVSLQGKNGISSHSSSLSLLDQRDIEWTLDALKPLITRLQETHNPWVWMKQRQRTHQRWSWRLPVHHLLTTRQPDKCTCQTSL